MSSTQPTGNILGKPHLDQLNQALERLRYINQQIVLAKQAGIDVSVQEGQAADALSRIMALKGTYFPGQ